MTDKLLTIIAKRIKNINEIEDATQQYYFKKNLKRNLEKHKMLSTTEQRYELEPVYDFFGETEWE